MKTAQEIDGIRKYEPLIENHGYFVLVSHQELDSLIARLMHVAELDSDKEHRDALKGELKSISRNWLDSLYEEAGYTNYSFEDHGQIVNLAGDPPKN
jgi:hypothetical protein